MKESYKPKFKVGDIVSMKDEFSFNPIHEVVSIGRIEAIHIYKGKSVCALKTEEGTFEYSGRITYTISGFSLSPEEKNLQLFTGEI